MSLVLLEGLRFAWMCDLLPGFSCIAILRCNLHVAAEAGSQSGIFFPERWMAWMMSIVVAGRSESVPAKAKSN